MCELIAEWYELYGIAILTKLAASHDIFTATIHRGGIVT